MNTKTSFTNLWHRLSATAKATFAVLLHLSRRTIGEVAISSRRGVLFVIVFGLLASILIVQSINVSLVHFVTAAASPSNLHLVAEARSKLTEREKDENEIAEIVNVLRAPTPDGKQKHAEVLKEFTTHTFSEFGSPVQITITDLRFNPNSAQEECVRIYGENYTPLQSIQVAKVDKPEFVAIEIGATERSITLDLFFRNDGNWQRLEWWNTNALADSNEIFDVQDKLGFLREPSYPTSTTAMTTWIRTHWRSVVGRLNLFSATLVFLQREREECGGRWGV